ncbi:MAG: hypothetical protein PVI57_01610 [Gemmatimonadota bacterium]
MDPDFQAKREYSQLLRMHERLLLQLQRVREELTAPGTRLILREIKNRSGSSPDTRLQDVISQVEEAIRSLKLSESNIQQELIEDVQDLSVEGVPNLPAHLARFLAERKEFPGFSWEVTQDEVRGWIIRWKEYTHAGTVRGFGQFYERPYAWLDE